MQLATILCEMPYAITHAAHPKRCEDGMWRCNPKNVFFTEVRAPALTDVVSFIFKHIVLKTGNLDFFYHYILYILHIYVLIYLLIIVALNVGREKKV